MRIRQVMVTGRNNVELQDGELDEHLLPGEFLVETECTFISAGTELAVFTGREPMTAVAGSWCAYPFKPGYANIGMVTAVGPGVTRTKVGERVFTAGIHASVVKRSQEMLVIGVPAGISPATAAATRLASVAASAAVMAQLPLHSWVVVFGLGIVGNLAAQIFRILGGRVIGVEPVASRRALAERCGIAVTVGGDAAAVHAALEKLTDGQMADITVEATGFTPVIQQALRATANVGQLILLGSPRAPHEGNMTALLSEIHLRNIAVRGALEWCVPAYPPMGAIGGRTLPLASLYSKQQMIFDWVKAGQLQVDPLISHRMRPEGIKEAYAGLMEHPETHTGVVLDWRK